MSTASKVHGTKYIRQESDGTYTVRIYDDDFQRLEFEKRGIQSMERARDTVLSWTMGLIGKPLGVDVRGRRMRLQLRRREDR